MPALSLESINKNKKHDHFSNFVLFKLFYKSTAITFKSISNGYLVVKSSKNVYPLLSSGYLKSGLQKSQKKEETRAFCSKTRSKRAFIAMSNVPFGEVKGHVWDDERAPLTIQQSPFFSEVDISRRQDSISLVLQEQNL